MSEITAVGVFENRERAERAIEALREAGFAPDDLGLISREEPDLGLAPLEDSSRSAGDLAPVGVGIGAAVGGTAGLGYGLALISGLIPGVGPVVAGGALTLLLAGTGAAAGSLLGGLLSLGVSEDEAEHYQSELAAGRALVTARGAERFYEALKIMSEQGALLQTSDAARRS